MFNIKACPHLGVQKVKQNSLQLEEAYDNELK